MPLAWTSRNWTERTWTEEAWKEREIAVLSRIERAGGDAAAWQIGRRAARSVLRNYSTSFFLVTRFLPSAKRDQVDAIYAAVRYPDEIVDTFPLDSAAKLARISAWRSAYRRSLSASSCGEAIRAGVPLFLALFSDVVRRNGIPHDFYESFLDAMSADAQPSAYASLDDLIDNYVYGSAIVVGYFLAYVYGAERPSDWQRALDAARDLGIALQLTNFVRDVSDDQRRGRVYIPQDLLRAKGLSGARLELARIAERKYQAALQNLDAFAADSRVAIRACIDVYGKLNHRVAANPDGLTHRQTVPAIDKFKSLPPAKFWRIPLAYLGAI